MIRLTPVVAILALIGILLISAAPAAAEFTSNNESTEGGGYSAISIEGMGPTIDCGTTESSQVSWQVKKEGKASTSGPELAIKFSSWGQCSVEYEEKERELSGGACTWETSETESESKVTNKVSSTCKLKGEIAGKSCEVTLEPKFNEKLSTLTLVSSGKSNENLVADLALEGVTVGASGAGCETAGIKSTSSAKLSGAIEALGVSSAVEQLAPWRFSYTGEPGLFGVGSKLTVFVTNEGASAKPNVIAQGHAGHFKVYNKTMAECSATLLLMNQACSMTVEFIKYADRVKSLYLQVVEGGQITAEIVIRGTSKV